MLEYLVNKVKQYYEMTAHIIEHNIKEQTLKLRPNIVAFEYWDGRVVVSNVQNEDNRTPSQELLDQIAQSIQQDIEREFINTPDVGSNSPYNNINTESFTAARLYDAIEYYRSEFTFRRFLPTYLPLGIPTLDVISSEEGRRSDRLVLESLSRSSFIPEPIQDNTENLPDHTQLSWEEWDAKVDALLAEMEQYKEKDNGNS